MCRRNRRKRYSHLKYLTSCWPKSSNRLIAAIKGDLVQLLQSFAKSPHKEELKQASTELFEKLEANQKPCHKHWFSFGGGISGKDIQQSFRKWCCATRKLLQRRKLSDVATFEQARKRFCERARNLRFGDELELAFMRLHCIISPMYGNIQLLTKFESKERVILHCQELLFLDRVSTNNKSCRDRGKLSRMNYTFRLLREEKLSATNQVKQILSVRQALLSHEESNAYKQIDMAYTQQVQFGFVETILVLQKRCQKRNVSVTEISTIACSGSKMPPEFQMALKYETDIEEAFIIINIHLPWYQVDLLKQFAAFLGSDIREVVSAYEDKLRAYLNKRAKPLPSIKGEEMLAIRIDDAWDKEALQGEACKRSCKQIAAILGKSGRVRGSLYGQYLLVTVF